MPTENDMLICVQREWDGWRTAEVRLGDLQNIHWHQPGRAPRPLLHGYISCASITAGEIPHDCERTAGPHRLLVCVLKRHSAPSVYAEIARRADACGASLQDPGRYTPRGVRATGPNVFTVR